MYQQNICYFLTLLFLLFLLEFWIMFFDDFLTILKFVALDQSIFNLVVGLGPKK